MSRAHAVEGLEIGENRKRRDRSRKVSVRVSNVKPSNWRKWRKRQTKIIKMKKIGWKEVDENIWDPLLDDEEEDEF